LTILVEEKGKKSQKAKRATIELEKILEERERKLGAQKKKGTRKSRNKKKVRSNSKTKASEQGQVKPSSQKHQVKGREGKGSKSQE
jgi:hypothetical protein